MSTSHITLPFSLQTEHPFPLLGSVLVPGRESFSPMEGIYFPPLVTNDMSVINNNSSLLMYKVPLLKNNMPLSKINQPSDNKRGEKRKNRCKSGDWDGNCGMMRTVDCNLSTV